MGKAVLAARRPTLRAGTPVLGRTGCRLAAMHVDCRPPLPSTEHRAPSTRAKRPGFTLIEVLVAAAVLAIGISAGVRTLGALTRSTAAAEDRITAVRLATERLALLEADEQVAAGETSGAFASEPRFQWRQEVAAASEPGLLEATVTILWQDGQVPRHYSVTTYLLDPAQAPVAEGSDG
jgi:general secretion pathway protein I